MSLQTLPILFFNLGGEMLYILDQRLKAQNVPPKKAVKVLRDIVSQMFDSRCVNELYRPQKVFSQQSLRLVFDRLAHASIMKLNSTAMDKLYDLMNMAVKYQFLLSPRAFDVVLVTLNHLDTIRDLVGDSQPHITLLDTAIQSVATHYHRLTTAQTILLRATLLTTFQDNHKRVSVFLKNKAQMSNGRFFIPSGGPVPTGFDIPGTIRYFDDGKVSEDIFTVPVLYESAQPAGSTGITGDRVITLGSNLYATSTPTKADIEGPSGSGGSPPISPPAAYDPLVKAELELLEKLLVGIRAPPSSDDTFKLKLFDDEDTDEVTSAKRPSANLLQISPTKKGKEELNQIMADLSVQTQEDSSEDKDLLDLMDSVS